MGVRLWGLQRVPPGLARDEALNADIVEKIWAGEHALFFREGFGHEPLYHYVSAPFQKLIGDNFLAIRLPSLFLGVLLVALVWAWVRREWGEMPAFTTTLLLTLSWWGIIFSRVGLRPILMPVLLVLAAWHWHKRPTLAGVWLGLAIYSYTAARAIYLLPLIYLIYLWLWRKRLPAVQYKNAHCFRCVFVNVCPSGTHVESRPQLARAGDTTQRTFRCFVDRGLATHLANNGCHAGRVWG